MKWDDYSRPWLRHGAEEALEAKQPAQPAAVVSIVIIAIVDFRMKMHLEIIVVLT